MRLRRAYILHSNLLYLRFELEEDLCVRSPFLGCQALAVLSNYVDCNSRRVGNLILGV